jgi:LDH2 family malate/lactate/ureidoglycolate dehydrogenase
MSKYPDKKDYATLNFVPTVEKIPTTNASETCDKTIAEVQLCANAIGNKIGWCRMADYKAIALLISKAGASGVADVGPSNCRKQINSGKTSTVLNGNVRVSASGVNSHGFRRFTLLCAAIFGIFQSHPRVTIFEVLNCPQVASN